MIGGDCGGAGHSSTEGAMAILEVTSAWSSSLPTPLLPQFPSVSGPLVVELGNCELGASVGLLGDCSLVPLQLISDEACSKPGEYRWVLQGPARPGDCSGWLPGQ